MSEKILIASDHAGFELKEKLEARLRALGFDVEDLGADSTQSTDYADYAHPLARQVSEGKVKRGVLMCGTGLGMSYTANRYPHVRAAVAWSPEIAKLAREHNDANVLSLGARMYDEDTAVRYVELFLATPFSDEPRHSRRIGQITDYERTGELPPLPGE